MLFFAGERGPGWPEVHSPTVSAAAAPNVDPDVSPH